MALFRINGKLMKMDDWIQKLDDFLKASDKNLLDNAGEISHKKAVAKANSEYHKYRKIENEMLVSDFDREMKLLENNVKNK